MSEKKKIIMTILGGLALLFFIFSNFCRPLITDNAQCIQEYKKLKTEVKTLVGVDKQTLSFTENKLKTSISQLEEKFVPKGASKFVQQLTSSAKGLDIIFSDITRKDPQDKDGYAEFPIDVEMKTSFSEFSRYLLALEKNSLMIGIGSLRFRKYQPQSSILNIKITFSGFKLSLTPVPITEYMEEKYNPIDNERLNALFEPLSTLDNQGVVSRLVGYDPFFSAYDLKEPEADGHHFKVEQEAALGEKSIIDTLSLQGILYVQKEKAAMINDVVVKEGDTIEGAKVVAIQDYKVILKYLGKEYILTMGVGDAFIN